MNMRNHTDPTRHQYKEAERTKFTIKFTTKAGIIAFFLNLIVNFVERTLPPAREQMFSHEKLKVYSRAIDFAA